MPAVKEVVDATAGISQFLPSSRNVKLIVSTHLNDHVLRFLRFTSCFQGNNTIQFGKVFAYELQPKLKDKPTWRMFNVM